VATGVMLCGSLFVGCSTARTDVGTTDESCYLALPTATKAVGGHGHLAGIRKFTLTNLHSFAPRLYGRVARRVPAHQAVCVAAFTGHFTADSVSKPFGRPEGVLAVSVVTSPGNELLGTLILSHVPVRFSHTHLF
jgi:hypothetical protein